MNTQSIAKRLKSKKSFLYKVEVNTSQSDISHKYGNNTPIKKLHPSHKTYVNTSKRNRSFFMERINELIEINMDNEDYGIEQLCRDAGASRTQIHNKIKKWTGLSTTHYVRSVKLQKAKYLLANTDLNITQISYEIGIKYPCYFSRIFEKSVGMCPKKFRKTWQKAVN